MMNIIAILLGVSTLSYLIGAMIITRYEKISSTAVPDFAPCGINASASDYCAARVHNGICEPLTRDWCAANDMSIIGTYFIKRTVIDRPETTLMQKFIRQIPIYLSSGSEIEFKFMLHSNWTGFRVNLFDDYNNIGLQINLSPGGDFYSTYKFDSLPWGPKEGYINTFIHNVHTEYTLGIRCDISSFLIYFNGQYEFATNNYTIPLDSLKNVNLKFKGVDGDMYQVVFRT